MRTLNEVMVGLPDQPITVEQLSLMVGERLVTSGLLVDSSVIHLQGCCSIEIILTDPIVDSVQSESSSARGNILQGIGTKSDLSILILRGMGDPEQVIRLNVSKLVVIPVPIYEAICKDKLASFISRSQGESGSTLLRSAWII